MARHGKMRAHGFAHCSADRKANLKICYMVIMYKLAEQIIQQEKKIHVPPYYGIFKERDIEFTKIIVDDKYDRVDKQPDVIAFTANGTQYLIEFTFDYKVQHKQKIDYNNLNCIEIDLSMQTLESLHDFLLYSDECKKWINNQDYFDDIESKYARHGKKVKIVDDVDCVKCFKYDNCCAVRLTGESQPIKIENNGRFYRVCKVQECNNLINNIERNRKQDENSFDMVEHELRKYCIKGQPTIQAEQIQMSQVEDTAKKRKEQEMAESIETAKISLNLRTCFMCRRNLEWKNRDDGYAHCAISSTIGVSKNTPPDTAKTCRSFIAKINDNKAT